MYAIVLVCWLIRVVIGNLFFAWVFATAAETSSQFAEIFIDLLQLLVVNKGPCIIIFRFIFADLRWRFDRKDQWLLSIFGRQKQWSIQGWAWTRSYQHIILSWLKLSFQSLF